MTIIYFSAVLICYFYLLNKLKDKPNDEWRIKQKKEGLVQDKGSDEII
jgi:hypothetical protein